MCRPSRPCPSQVVDGWRRYCVLALDRGSYRGPLEPAINVLREEEAVSCQQSEDYGVLSVHYKHLLVTNAFLNNSQTQR